MIDMIDINKKRYFISYSPPPQKLTLFQMEKCISSAPIMSTGRIGKVNNEDVIFTKKLTFLYDMSTCHQISTEINIEDTFNPIKFWQVRKKDK